MVDLGRPGGPTGGAVNNKPAGLGAFIGNNNIQQNTNQQDIQDLSIQNLPTKIREHNKKADEYIKAKQSAPYDLRDTYEQLAATETEACNTLNLLYKAQQSDELNILDKHRNQQKIQDYKSRYNTLVNRIDQLKSKIQNTENQTTQQQNSKDYKKTLSNIQQKLQKEHEKDMNEIKRNNEANRKIVEEHEKITEKRKECEHKHKEVKKLSKEINDKLPIELEAGLKSKVQEFLKQNPRELSQEQVQDYLKNAKKIINQMNKILKKIN